MREPQQAAINVVGGQFVAAVVITDGAGAITAAANSFFGFTAVGWVTDGTNGLFDLTCENANGANIALIGNIGGVAGSCSAAPQGTTAQRVTCFNAAGAALNLAATATVIRLLGYIRP